MNPTILILALLTFALLASAVWLWRSRARIEAERKDLADRFRGVLDAEAERRRILDGAIQEAQEAWARDQQERVAREKSLQELREHIALKTTELSDITTALGVLHNEFAALDEESQLQSFGYYQPHYGFSELPQYTKRLDEIRAAQKTMLKEKTAAVCAIEWRVDGSIEKGRKSTNQTMKLMLRAFNGEADAAIAKVRYNNILVMEERIRKSHERINELASVQQCRISDNYRDSRLEELRLVFEYEEKQQAEKEEQRRIREQMRDEEIAQRQIEKAREEAEKDELRFEKALAKAREEVGRAQGEKFDVLNAQIQELQEKVAAAHAEKERAIARAQMTRSGHVYVISNVGSLGEKVFKIGMTRRLDPLDRVKELGDASVPFQFDIHAIIFSEDAPALEAALHRTFQTARVNRVNERKEFFRLDLEEIRTAVTRHHGEIEFTMMAEAEEYRKTLAILEEENRHLSEIGPKIPIRNVVVETSQSTPSQQPGGAPNQLRRVQQ